MTRDALSIQEIQCDMSFNQIFSVIQKIETHAILYDSKRFFHEILPLKELKITL